MDTPLSLTIGEEVYYYQTDANKNVLALTNSLGETVASYKYSPFGKVVSSTGLLAEENPFRFSSEYHDDETNLVYYNYRYYSPSLGRWLSRDPIEEQGGYNLYNMVKNNVINYWDYLGNAQTNAEKKTSVRNALDYVNRNQNKFPRRGPILPPQKPVKPNPKTPTYKPGRHPIQNHPFAPGNGPDDMIIMFMACVAGANNTHDKALKKCNKEECREKIVTCQDKANDTFLEDLRRCQRAYNLEGLDF